MKKRRYAALDIEKIQNNSSTTFQGGSYFGILRTLQSEILQWAPFDVKLKKNKIKNKKRKEKISPVHQRSRTCASGTPRRNKTRKIARFFAVCRAILSMIYCAQRHENLETWTLFYVRLYAFKEIAPRSPRKLF